jgi:Fur family ferric uptake transcriptional regulator
MEHTYKTKQREQILDFLKSNESRCVSAEEIIEGISTPEKRASKATVYRCLDLFTASGTVSKFIGAHGDGATYRLSDSHHSHFHLKCTDCNRTECVDSGFINRMQEHFLDSHGFSVSKTQTVIYGLCRSCRIKQRRTAK